jgi:hypothetical protein
LVGTCVERAFLHCDLECGRTVGVVEWYLKFGMHFILVVPLDGYLEERGGDAFELLDSALDGVLQHLELFDRFKLVEHLWQQLLFVDQVVHLQVQHRLRH